jgi:uncharacterized protein YneF (UPF0154 family)
MKTLIEILALIGFTGITFGAGVIIGYWLCRKSITWMMNDQAERLIHEINNMPL